MLISTINLAEKIQYDVLDKNFGYNHYPIRFKVTKRKYFIHHKIKNPVPWWNAVCEKIKRLRRATYKKWDYSKALEDLISNKNPLPWLKK